MARRLIIVKIPSSGFRLGPLGEEVIRRRITDRETALPSEARSASYWRRLRTELIERLTRMRKQATLAGVTIFQEGVCVGGKQGMKMAAELAALGNRNYGLVLELTLLGAKLERTEDARLLSEEYNLLCEAIAASRIENRVAARKVYQARGKELTAARDAYMATRIDRILEADSVGVLFVAPPHRVEKMLPADIRVTVLRPARGGSAIPLGWQRHPRGTRPR
jgi:hypothetical protein